jgi:ferredoxin
MPVETVDTERIFLQDLAAQPVTALDRPTRKPEGDENMADLSEKWEDNIAGPWYVDKTCILCSLCVDLAPNNFQESADGDHDKIYKQPDNPEELQACQEAMEQCPVNSIGNDA